MAVTAVRAWPGRRGIRTRILAIAWIPSLLLLAGGIAASAVLTYQGMQTGQELGYSVASAGETGMGGGSGMMMGSPGFDIAADPNETTNLADSDGHKDVLETYKAKLKAMQKKMEDPWIMKWEYE